MHIVSAYNGPHASPEVLAKAETLDEALAYVADNLNPILVEIDEDHPTCADGILADSRVITIEPEGFTLKG